MSTTRAEAEQDASAAARTSFGLGVLPGFALVGYAIALYVLSIRLSSDALSMDSARAWLAASSVIAGALYLATLYGAVHAGSGSRSVAWVIGAALLARGIVSLSPPLLEDDYNRYLWDGAVTVQGISPYRYAPQEVSLGLVRGPDAQTLQAMSVRSGSVLPSVNHPHLTTIYPPLAQAAFALASVIDPYGIFGWRLVLFACDCVTLLLLAHWLKTLSLPVIHLAWYAANPLLLREVYSALHMDVLVLPIVVGAALLAAHRRHGWAAHLALLGAGIKVWPALLVPVFLRPLWGLWRALLPVCVSLVAVALIAWTPLWNSPEGRANGFVAYGESWQNNDGFFRAGIWITERVLGLLSIPPWHSHSLMRLLVGAVLIGVVSYVMRSPRHTGADAPAAQLAVVGSMFVISPTQFPWYWIWCLPYLCVRPSFPLLLYVALLPLYHRQDLGPAVYWVEHLPVWMLLGLGAYRAWRPTLRLTRPSRGGASA